MDNIEGPTYYQVIKSKGYHPDRSHGYIWYIQLVFNNLHNLDNANKCLLSTRSIVFPTIPLCHLTQIQKGVYFIWHLELPSKRQHKPILPKSSLFWVRCFVYIKCHTDSYEQGPSPTYSWGLWERPLVDFQYWVGWTQMTPWGQYAFFIFCARVILHWR